MDRTCDSDHTPTHARDVWAGDMVELHGLNASQSSVLRTLCEMADASTLECWPGEARLSARSGASERSINRIVAVLASKGVIAVRRQQRKPNRYKLLIRHFGGSNILDPPKSSFLIRQNGALTPKGTPKKEPPQPPCLENEVLTPDQIGRWCDEKNVSESFRQWALSKQLRTKTRAALDKALRTHRERNAPRAATTSTADSVHPAIRAERERRK